MLTLLLLATVADVSPNFATAAVAHDADDPAIWVNPVDPSRSRILGTDKIEKDGALYVYDLRGRMVQRIGRLDRPNNVDVEGNLAVVTERMKRRLKVYGINPRNGMLNDLTGETAVFEGEAGEDGAPMGIGLYRRPKDGALFAIVTPKAGPKENHLAQYRLVLNPRTNRYDAFLVRRFGRFSGVKETESVCVDDALGTVYYSDETVGTRKYLADPDVPNADRELAFFNRAGTRGDHEGIAIWARPNGTGYLVCTDQLENNTVYRVFRREGTNAFVGSFRIGADETDGIEITSQSLGRAFPSGIFVAMNSKGRNFFVVDWRKTGLR